MGSGFNLFKNWIDISRPEVNQWIPYNLQGLVPPDATGVILRLANQWYRSIAAVRQTGSSDDFSQYSLVTWKAHTYAFVGLDSNLSFEAYCKNVASAYEGNPIKIYLCGYTDEAIVFFKNAIWAGRFSQYWSLFDASPYVPSEATGGIWLIFNTHPTTGQQFSIRGFGSTDRHFDSETYGGHATHLGCGGEASNFCYALVAFGQGKKIEVIDKATSGGRYIQVYLVGYTKPPVNFFLNSVLKKVSANGVWEGISLPEVGTSADGVILEIRNTAPGRKSIAVREPSSVNGDVEHSYLGLETAFWGVCGLNEQRQFEAYTEWAQRTMLFVHGWTQPEGAPQEFPCPYCGQVSYSQEELNQHILSQHTFACPHCSAIFHTQSELDAHILSQHHFECPYCGQVFFSNEELQDHIRAEHTFPCPYCGAIFHTQEELQQHIETAHPQPPTTRLNITSGYLEGILSETETGFRMDINSGYIEGTVE